MKIELEVIAFDLFSCKVAELNGADRIELCANPHEGGTTPSYGMIAQARKLCNIQLFPIIRPRGGDFLYSDEEFFAMQDDITMCKELGCEGVVIGMLNEYGTIDRDRCRKLVELANNMQVTFHRAFDRVKDQFVALENLIELGCSRILTSGGYPNVIEGINVLKELVEKASGKVTIMPGSGVRSENIHTLLQITKARAFHSSARMSIGSAMKFKKPEMNESLEQITLMGEEVAAIRKKIDQYIQS